LVVPVAHVLRRLGLRFCGYTAFGCVTHTVTFTGWLVTFPRLRTVPLRLLPLRFTFTHTRFYTVTVTPVTHVWLVTPLVGYTRLRLHFCRLRLFTFHYNTGCTVYVCVVRYGYCGLHTVTYHGLHTLRYVYTLVYGLLRLPFWFDLPLIRLRFTYVYFTVAVRLVAVCWFTFTHLHGLRCTRFFTGCVYAFTLHTGWLRSRSTFGCLRSTFGYTHYTWLRLLRSPVAFTHGLHGYTRLPRLHTLLPFHTLRLHVTVGYHVYVCSTLHGLVAFFTLHTFTFTVYVWLVCTFVYVVAVVAFAFTFAFVVALYVCCLRCLLVDFVVGYVVRFHVAGYVPVHYVCSVRYHTRTFPHVCLRCRFTRLRYGWLDFTVTVAFTLRLVYAFTHVTFTHVTRLRLRLRTFGCVWLLRLIWLRLLRYVAFGYVTFTVGYVTFVYTFCVTRLHRFGCGLRLHVDRGCVVTRFTVRLLRYVIRCSGCWLLRWLLRCCCGYGCSFRLPRLHVYGYGLHTFAVYSLHFTFGYVYVTLTRLVGYVCYVYVWLRWFAVYGCVWLRLHTFTLRLVYLVGLRYVIYVCPTLVVTFTRCYVYVRLRLRWLRLRYVVTVWLFTILHLLVGLYTHTHAPFTHARSPHAHVWVTGWLLRLHTAFTCVYHVYRSRLLRLLRLR